MYRSEQNIEIHKSNQAYIDNLWRKPCRWTETVKKPVPGMFRLRDRAGLSDARGSVWPTCHSDSVADGEVGHSTPGRLLEVARKLLERATNGSSTLSSSTCTAVYRALLANDALELLCCRTPTTSFEALAARHEFEATAECQFLGVEEHFEVQARMCEIRRDVHEIGHWFGPLMREPSQWNAETAVLGRLISVFRDHNRFDEEQAVRVRERELHRRMWFRRKFSRYLDRVRWMNPAYLLAVYVEFLLKSVPGFVLAIAAWQVKLTLLFALTTLPRRLDWPLAFQAALVSFFCVQPPSTSGVKFKF